MAIKSFKKLKSRSLNRDGYWSESAKQEFVLGLTRLLKHHDVSNAELARRIDRSAPYVSKALRGDENFTIESMVKLVRAIGGKLHIHVSDKACDIRWLEVFEGRKTEAVARNFNVASSEKFNISKTVEPGSDYVAA